MPQPTGPRAVLIDLAGVMHIEDEPIDGAIESLRALRSEGLALRFLTNTTRSPRSQVVAKLQRMGFGIATDEVQTAVLATRHLVEKRRLRPHYLVHPDITEEIGPSHPAPNAVVLGDAGPYFSYKALNAAFRLLMQDCAFIAMARNRYFRERDGLTLDMGAFVTGLEFISGITAEIAGKPSATFFQSALDELDVHPEETVLIGDDLSDDIGGAQAAGIRGILVRTGKYRPGDESHPEIKSTAIVDDFSAAVRYILGR